MNKKLKAFLCGAMILTASAGLVGCGSKEPATENNTVVEESTPVVASFSADELYSKITADIEFPMQQELDATMLSDVYGIDTSLLKSFKVQTPMMSAHISEVGVFELNNASDAEAVIAGIEQRANNAGTMLYPSLQETYDNRQVVTVGNYVLFVMDENADIIVDNFKAALN